MLRLAVGFVVVSFFWVTSSSSSERDVGFVKQQRRRPGGDECVSRSRAGTRRVQPKGDVVRFEASLPVARGLECETRSSSPQSSSSSSFPWLVSSARRPLTQVCCRPTAELLTRMEEWRTYFDLATRGVEDATEWRCFPSLIIAGAQKCGSTALTGLLLSHPEVAFGRNKELHYFDKNESQCTGAFPYLLNFPPAAPTTTTTTTTSKKSRRASITTTTTTITAEATPFYLADPLACGRMARQVPFAKVVILVREPLARARSEYAMKTRRVDSQDTFVAALESPAIVGRLLECLVSAGPRNVTFGGAAFDCAPAELRSHAKFPLFRAGLVRRLRKDYKRRRGQGLKEQHRARPRLQKKKPPVGHDAAEDAETAWWAWLRSCFVKSGPPLDDNIDGSSSPSKSSSSPRKQQQQQRQRLDASIKAKLFPPSSLNASYEGVVVGFDAGACFPEGARERLAGDFGAVIVGEVQVLEECARTHFPHWEGTAPPTAKDAAALVATCVKVRTGISIQYAYRGLYAAQLARCVNSGLPRDALLVVDNEHLRQRPQAVLDKVAAHVGISRHTYDPDLFDVANLQDAITKKYPTFEQNSGWRLVSDHTDDAAPLQPGDRARVRDFFRPHNDLLFTMIGERFDHWND